MSRVFVGMLILFVSLACAVSQSYTNNAVYDGVQLAMKNTSETTAELQQLLQTGNALARHDYISGYDFSAARLQDLPWELHWFGAGESSEGRYGNYVAAHHSDWSYLDYDYQGEFPPERRPYSEIDASTCRLTDGAFYGVLYTTNGLLRAAVPDADNPSGIVLTVMGYRDVNADGYLDAICRLYIDTGGTASSVHAIVLLQKVHIRAVLPGP
jgi:hypothetical protein